MHASLGSYFLVAAGSMLKFILGPLMGYGLSLPPIITGSLSALGVMLTALIVTFLGAPLRPHIACAMARFRRKRAPQLNPQEAKKRQISPRIQAIWNRWGMAGIALLTPVLLTPPVGAIAAVALGVPRRRMLLHLLWASVFWSIVETTVIYWAGQRLGLAPRR